MDFRLHLLIDAEIETASFFCLAREPRVQRIWRRHCLVEFSHLYLSARKGLSPIPQFEDPAAFFFLGLRPRLLADRLRPSLEAAGHFRTGKLGNWVALINCLYHLRIVI